jgi:hypothetical protein
MITWLAYVFIGLNHHALTMHMAFSSSRTPPSTIALEAVWQAFNDNMMHFNGGIMMRL